MRNDRINLAMPALMQRFGPQLSTAAAILEQHSHDESWNPPALPDAVIFAQSIEDVVDAVRACAAHRIAIVPFGVGSSLEGQVNALAGGVSLDLSRMDRILGLRPADMDVTVQAGVTRKQLNEHLRDCGLFFPVDPGANATLGGMAATRASGTNAVRYGTMKDVVLSLKVVLADGTIIETAKRARKTAAGYDLTRLFIGSEGTLGVICELTLRLFGVPETIAVATCGFRELRQAVDAVIEIMQSGANPSRIELLDEVQVDAINRYAKLDLPAQPTLLLEFAGGPQAVQEQIAAVEEILLSHEGGGFRWATDHEGRNRLWQARHQAAYAAIALRQGCKGLATDVCVPISRLADCILETKADLAQISLPAPLAGHVGDGNFHLMLVLDPAQPEEVRQAEWVNERLAERAIAMGGTCTGEQGIGIGKARFLTAELGPAVAAMKSVKDALDPQGIFNPGKIFLS
jgi:D-lactate dehydrogenase (cytochrome)